MFLAKNIITCISLLFPLLIFSQAPILDLKSRFQLDIKKASGAINLDGHLDEDSWLEADVGSDFWQKQPYFAENADPRTEVRVTYDEDNLYFGAICYQTENIIIRSLKRDEFWDNDAIAIVLDPLNTKTNAYLFGGSAEGGQYDALRSETSGINRDWNNKWFVETHQADDFWSLEMAIPLKIIRYDENINEWGLNFVRNLQLDNENHNWTAVPESFWPPNPAFAGKMNWDAPPSKKTGNFNLIPFVTSSVNKQKDEDTKFNADAGLDARLAVTSTLNLDVTINPDFSQIEADELVTNLTRFNIGLPEKRTFFLENSDLFSDYGLGVARPFFSRRIGLDSEGRAVPIIYGARLTGNINPDLRIGLMNMHSGTTEDAYGQNNTAFAVQQRFGRSIVQGMFINRQSFDGFETIENDFGRNASLEAKYFSNNGQISFWGGLHQSFKDAYNSKTGMYNIGFRFRNPAWNFSTNNVTLQDNYYADLGFIARVNNYDASRDTTIRSGFTQSYSELEYNIRPQNSKLVRRHNIGFENLLVYNNDGSFNERYNRLRYFLSLNNGDEYKIRINNSEVDLLYPFRFTSSEYDPLPAEKYRFTDVILEYESDERKPFSYEVSAQYGGFYNGTLKKIELGVKYRIQPWGNFGISYQRNDLKFPEQYGNRLISAVVSKVEIAFNRDLIWTSLFQYVDQSDFVGINSRLQWRYSPMSDLFLVFVDNYDVLTGIGRSGLESSNRALILKLSYWY
ncbi:MAG: carbohydrate binding family 9 domain-containing protein [Saprospiraceae bacterium]|nr:carbohydrate binding family 9 domain-containing protein [Saprospiraceae bacterium]